MTANTAKASTKKAKTTKAKAAKPKVATARAATRTAKSAAPKAPPARILKAGEKKPPFDRFRKWNLWLGIVLVAEAVAVLASGGPKAVELTTQYLAKDGLASEAAGSGVFSAATRHLVDINISWIVAGFLVVFAAGFLLAATVWQKKYEAWLARGVNKLRWAMLGIGGGMAVATVALLSGATDVVVLLLISGIVALACAFAAALELLGPGRRLSRLLAAGAVTGLVLPWLFFAVTVAGALKYGGSVPPYLYFVYAVVTLWFVAIGLATHFRVTQKGKWADTSYTEKMFMGLGFGVATVLALQISAGAL